MKFLAWMSFIVVAVVAFSMIQQTGFDSYARVKSEITLRQGERLERSLESLSSNKTKDIEKIQGFLAKSRKPSSIPTP